MSKTIEVTITDDDLFSAFVKGSEQLGLSVEAAMAEAIKEWLLVLDEDREDARIVSERMAEYRRTGESYTHEQVKKDLGID